MATRKLVLGSAASLVLAGALIASVPGLAQQAAPADKAAYDAAQANYNQAKAKYDKELRDYNNKTAAYQKQRDEYAAKLDAYNNNNAQVIRDQARRSDVVVVAQPAPPAPDVVVVEQPATPAPDLVVAAPPPDTVVVAGATPSTEVIVENPPDDFVRRLAFANPPVTLWRIDRVTDPNHDLFNAPVLDAAGLTVGRFRRVEIKEPGYPAAVITLNNVNRTISMPVEHFRFDPNTGVVIADMPANLIYSIPSGFPVG